MDESVVGVALVDKNSYFPFILVHISPVLH